MEKKGIVRRIDELGRVVIPKEIRKNFNIKNGEMVEIIPDLDNKIVIRKYSIIKNIKDVSFNVVNNISKITNFVCVVTDLSNIVNVSNNEIGLIEGKEITNDLYKVISNRDIYFSKNYDDLKLFKNDNNRYYNKLIVPIVNDTYIVGSIILLSLDLNKLIKESDISLLKFSSLIISESLI